MITLYILAGIGALVVGLSLMALIGFLATVCHDMSENRQCERAAAREHAKRFHHDSKLRDEAWWFSEDPATMQLLKELADSHDVYSVRETWRAARKSEGEKKP